MRGSPRQNAALLLVCTLALGLYLLGITWGLPFAVSWSVDDASPWRPLATPWLWLHSSHKYPYLHPFLNLVLYAPYLLWLALTGGLDPACLPTILPGRECFADPHGAPGTLMLISRVLSAVMAAGTVGVTYLLALELHRDRAAAIWSALIVAVSSIVVLYAHLGNLDVPHTFWFVLSLLFFARLVRRGDRADYLGFAITSGCALTTKEGIVGAYVLTGLAILAVHGVRHAPGRPRSARALGAALLDRKLVALAAILIGFYAVVQNVVFNFEGFREHLSFWSPSTGQRMHEHSEKFPGYVIFYGRLLRSLVTAMGAPLLALCAAGIPWSCWRRPRTVLIGIPLVSYVWFSLTLAGFVPVRFMIPIVPMLAVFGGSLAADLLRAPRPLVPLAAGAAIAAVAHGLLASLHVDLALRNDSRYVAEAWIASHVPRGERFAALGEPNDVPRLHWMGYVVAFPPPGDPASAVADLAPDYVILSEHSVARWTGARRVTEAAVPGYHTVWRGRGHEPLGRWFARPCDWINPEIAILKRDPAAPVAEATSSSMPGTRRSSPWP